MWYLTAGTLWWSAASGPQRPDARSILRGRAGSASIGFNGRRDRAGWGPVERDADPTWLFLSRSEPKYKNRLHLDVIATDSEAEIARLVGLGATRVADRDENGYAWTLMAGPEGNELDLGKER